MSTAPRICQREDIWPIRVWYQNLVSWNGGTKGMSPGSTALPPQPRLTLVANIFPIWLQFLPVPPLWSLVPGFLSGGFFHARDKRSSTGPISGSWPWAWATFLGDHTFFTSFLCLPLCSLLMTVSTRPVVLQEEHWRGIFYDCTSGY